MTNEHIVKTYDDELNRLNKTIIEMGGLAESQLAEAIHAVMKRDTEAASDVVTNDARVDALNNEVEAKVLRLLALRQPMARDLREILAALKISTDLERICDYAANVAKRSITLAHTPVARPVQALPNMARIAQTQIKNVLDAYIERDADKALVVWESDEALDELYTSFFRELLTYMMEDPRFITPGTHLLFMAKNIERIGDHATNIAETIHFLIHGVPPQGSRQKRDRTSSSVVLPGPMGLVESETSPT
jgi:phosphate transport system protein